MPEIVWIWIGWAVFWLGLGVAAQKFPPAPPVEPVVATAGPATTATLTAYATDTAGVLAPADVERLNAVLGGFEKETSNQIAVAIYPHGPPMPIEAFTLAVAESSRLGRKGLDNGAILSIFAQDRTARIEVGYGLEGSLTDARARRILETTLAPAWSTGDRGKAVDDTLAAIMGDVRNDYAAGRMPGRLTVLRRQLAVEIPRFVHGLYPMLVGVPTEGRIAIAFFGAFFVLGFRDGFRQAWGLLRNLRIAIGNLRAGRAATARTATVPIGSLVDVLKLLLFAGVLAGCAVGIVLIAGGGAYGNAGATLRW